MPYCPICSASYTGAPQRCPQCDHTLAPEGIVPATRTPRVAPAVPKTAAVKRKVKRQHVRYISGFPTIASAAEKAVGELNYQGNRVLSVSFSSSGGIMILYESID